MLCCGVWQNVTNVLHDFFQNLGNVQTKPYGLTSRKTVLFTVTAMRTSNLIWLLSWEKNVFPITLYITVVIKFKNININYKHKQAAHSSFTALNGK
jgi:hypothetical protein